MTRVAASDGVPLYVEAHGDGPPVVLSPGYCQSHENFRPQVESFARAGYRVVLWDYRGHGLSDAPEARPATRWRRWSTTSAACSTTRRRAAARWSAASPSAASPRCTSPSRIRSACSALVLDRERARLQEPRRRSRAGRRRSERIADRLERVGFEGYASGRSAPTAIGLRPELPAAQAAGRAIEAQNPRGVALFGRRVAGPAPGTIDRARRDPASLRS